MKLFALTNNNKNIFSIKWNFYTYFVLFFIWKCVSCRSTKYKVPTAEYRHLLTLSQQTTQNTWFIHFKLTSVQSFVHKNRQTTSFWTKLTNKRTNVQKVKKSKTQNTAQKSQQTKLAPFSLRVLHFWWMNR